MNRRTAITLPNTSQAVNMKFTSSG
jgi:hypothetical protein